MIKQKVILRKLKTDDGYFNFEGQSKIGMEFWIEANTFRVSHYRRIGSLEMFKALVVRAVDENQILVPAECLEFTTDFEIT